MKFMAEATVLKAKELLICKSWAFREEKQYLSVAVEFVRLKMWKLY